MCAVGRASDGPRTLPPQNPAAERWSGAPAVRNVECTYERPSSSCSPPVWSPRRAPPPRSRRLPSSSRPPRRLFPGRSPSSASSCRPGRPTVCPRSSSPAPRASGPEPVPRGWTVPASTWRARPWRRWTSPWRTARSTGSSVCLPRCLPRRSPFRPWCSPPRDLSSARRSRSPCRATRHRHRPPGTTPSSSCRRRLRWRASSRSTTFTATSSVTPPRPTSRSAARCTGSIREATRRWTCSGSQRSPSATQRSPGTGRRSSSR